MRRGISDVNIYTTRPSTKLTYAKSRYVWPNAMTSYITVRTGYGRFLRTDEMYLILAEAYARQNGGMGDAIGYLNTMRRVKFKTGEYVELKASDFTQETLLDYIAVERRRKCNESVITMRSRIWTKMIPVMYCKSRKKN